MEETKLAPESSILRIYTKTGITGGLLELCLANPILLVARLQSDPHPLTRTLYTLLLFRWTLSS